MVSFVTLKSRSSSHLSAAEERLGYNPWFANKDAQASTYAPLSRLASHQRQGLSDDMRAAPKNEQCAAALHLTKKPCPHP